MRLPIASDGWRFIIPFGVLGAGLLWVGHWVSILVGLLFLMFSIFCFFFFRDTKRTVPDDADVITSAGDGKVLDVETVGEGEHAGWRLIRVFLSVFDGHIQRAPMAGTIDRIDYKKGLFLDARHPQAHVENERSTMALSSDKGQIFVTQVAGLVARRVVCWKKEGETLKQGERYGLIRFGSQVDLLIPPHTDVLVKPGDRVKGGETIVAKWRK